MNVLLLHFVSWGRPLKPDNQLAMFNLSKVVTHLPLASLVSLPNVEQRFEHDIGVLDVNLAFEDLMLNHGSLLIQLSILGRAGIMINPYPRLIKITFCINT